MHLATAVAALVGHTSIVRDIKVAAAGNMALSGSCDRTVRLWDLRTSGACVRTMEGHSNWVSSVDMDGHCRTAVSGSEDKTVKRWDLGSGRCTETYEFGGSVRDVVMHESGCSFLGLGRDLASQSDVSSSVNAWAIGDSKVIMQADMASSACVPDSVDNRLFGSRDLSTIAYCSITMDQLEVCVWR